MKIADRQVVDDVCRISTKQIVELN